jgi:electron transport complex protein RnfG
MASVKRAGPFRLIATLGIAGFFSGVVLVTVFLATQPLILRNQAAALESAIYRVLPGSTTRKAFVLQNGTLVPFKEDGGGLPLQDAVFGAYDDDGKLVGYGIPSEGPGFQDTIKLIYGYDPESENIVGMEVLESKETPGLGDKIVKDQDFLDSFRALSIEPEVLTVKPGTSEKSNEVDTISGATISSKAVVKIINEGNRRWIDLVSKISESEGKP